MKRLSQLSLLIALAVLPLMTRAQAPTAATSTQTQRVFPEVGAGSRAIRRAPDGRYLVLVSPGAAVLIFHADGKKLGQVPAEAVGAAAIVFGVALDVDAAGRIYVADQGGNAVNVYAADGSLAAHVRVPAPIAIAALPRDEFAVSSANADHLISVYDFHGALLREFGDPVSPTDDRSLNRRLNLGALASDADGNLYFAFQYLPDPTVRKYDRFGYLGDEFSINEREFDVTEQLARRELARVKTGSTVAPREIITAIGVDRTTQELWIALGNLLVHADRNGRELDARRLDTSAGIGLQPRFFLVERDRLLLGNDLLGIYALPKASGSAATR